MTNLAVKTDFMRCFCCGALWFPGQGFIHGHSPIPIRAGCDAVLCENERTGLEVIRGADEKIHRMPDNQGKVEEAPLLGQAVGGSEPVSPIGGPVVRSL